MIACKTFNITHLHRKVVKEALPASGPFQEVVDSSLQLEYETEKPIIWENTVGTGYSKPICPIPKFTIGGDLLVFFSWNELKIWGKLDFGNKIFALSDNIFGQNGNIKMQMLCSEK